MRSPLSQLLAIGPELAAFILTSPLTNTRVAYAQATVPSPNLDLSKLGRVALAGDFDSISLYRYEGQNEALPNTNGSDALLSRYPDGTFRTIAGADGSIMAMCPFTRDGQLQGIVVGGNFTRLGGQDQEAQGIALYNPSSDEVVALPGLNGSVNAVFCDDDGTVYVGGAFTGGNSSNAIAWTSGWTNLPFQGFNGPVTSITKNPAGNIVFGGDFNGLGNTTTPSNHPDDQVIALSSGTITSYGTTGTDGFNNATNIICKTGDMDGSGNTWLLNDNTAGWWEGSYDFGFNPTKLRLYNTAQDGRGAKTWYFENLNSGGILNMDYFDADGNNRSCSNNCPLAQNTTAQDFHFVPPVGMNSFRVYITSWYGAGGGLAGIEMFQDDVFSFAVNDFNQPQCDGVSNSSSSLATPSSMWNRTSNDGQSTSDYLTATINDDYNLGPNVSVVFSPNIQQSGNYSITVYTPGCFQDNTCGSRGRVNLTGSMTSNDPPVSTILYQTNNYDKYDQIYYGYVDTSDASFQPQVTLIPDAGQSLPLTIVAQRVRFELIASNGGLNGLFEYNPNEATVNTDFSKSAIDTAGSNLNDAAIVNAVVTSGDQVFVGGNFSSDAGHNVISVSDNATSLPGNGLDSEVLTMQLLDDTIYFGGNFTQTQDESVKGLNGIAVYSIPSRQWSALGAGVEGVVTSIVPVTLNISSNNMQECLTISGDFSAIRSFGDNERSLASGFAVWVLSENNWLNNVPNVTIAIQGRLISYATYNENQTIYAGQIASQGLGISGAVELTGSGSELQPLNIKIMPASSSSSSAMRKRESSNSPSYTGVYGGLYYDENGLNVTVLGGHFTAMASNGSTIENLLFINNTDSTQVLTGISGLDADSTFMGMDTQDSVLYAGGFVTGSIGENDVNGLIAFDLVSSQFVSPQPPALQGDDVAVNAVSAQPDNAFVFVGGTFERAGSLPCPGLCIYDISARQWNPPRSGLEGVVNAMVWSSKNTLVVAGNVTVGGNQTTIATYDADAQTFQEYSGARDLPGPVTAISPADANYNSWWAAGMNLNDNSAFLSKYSNDGDTWTTVSGLGPGTEVRGLQLMSVSKDHSDNKLISDNTVLMLTGNINVEGFGNASAVLYNGTTFQPYILTNTQDGSQGTLSRLFVSNPQNFLEIHHHHLALGLVVLIGLAIALGLIFIIVVAGILIERTRRRREGYVPMAMDRNGQLARIPPETLLGSLQEKDKTPKL
ncbi:cellular morphogenesis protein [Polychaeton citri CBS 116435]|uniref:Cellular morphogenesis protein n=1 Tax=Polychaeton citri CBS 116435 TaxID=1314669 RepID=A0A9P4QE86_9PEZI|nr:cellular morphogenesis protein [Polychaeton citri CBS 116435]